jgi:vacuolar protein sorting-associated protein 52
VEDIGLSPAVVRKISEGEVNDSWLKALKEVDIKAKQIDSYNETDVKAVKDVKPEIEKLTNKAIERARDYFVARIKSLRAPYANAQVIQQAGFMRFKELFHFINDHQPQLAEEVCHAYINTMRWYYLNHFQRYRTSLEKLKLYQIEKEDTIGREESSKRSKGLLF